MASVDAAAQQHLKDAAADATMAVEDAAVPGKVAPAPSPATNDAKAKKPGFFEKLKQKQAEKAAEKEKKKAEKPSKPLPTLFGRKNALAAELQAEAAIAARRAAEAEEREPPVRKFPRTFVWGTGSSAYQVEGAFLDEGKGLSIWDAFTHAPGKVAGGATGDTSACHYYRFREDIALMKQMGVKSYRLSISWSRIFPTGRGKVNEKGVAFYNRLIDELVANKIQPLVTLYHWDLPLALQVEEDGWLSPKIVDHFARYAKTCFARFGDRVRHWVTLNEPWCCAVLGHDSGGQHAPGRMVAPAKEVYLVAHHMLLAHAKSYEIYGKLFRRKQKGKIGVALGGDWYEAKPAPTIEERRRNRKAADRALEFTIGWFARPLFQGDYPAVMRERIGNRLPRFTPEQREMLKGSCDFLGVNHYSTHLCEQPAWFKDYGPPEPQIKHHNLLLKQLGAKMAERRGGAGGPGGIGLAGKIGAKTVGEITGDGADGSVAGDGSSRQVEPPSPSAAAIAAGKVEAPRDFDGEAAAALAIAEAGGVPPKRKEDPFVESTGYWQDMSVDQSDDDAWKTTDMGWGVHPEGIRKVLAYVQAEYAPKGGIYVTENGVACAEADADEAARDIERAVYIKRYLVEVHKAIVKDDVDVRGYYVWSLLDAFEWGHGYTKKFGLVHVDHDSLERTPKMSANWYGEVAKRNRVETL